MEKSKSIQGVSQWPYKAVAQALEIIPRTLAQNCGANTIRTLTALRAKHAAGEWVIFSLSGRYVLSVLTFSFRCFSAGETKWGIDGQSGQIVKMDDLEVWEPLAVKAQTYKTAVEVS